MGLLLLKKAAIALPMMIPLLVATVLFNAYIQQEHFRVAEYLPAHECNNADTRCSVNFDFCFLQDAYLQPELRQKKALPDAADPEQELPAVLQSYSDLHFLTPCQSEADNRSERADNDPLLSSKTTESSSLNEGLRNTSNYGSSAKPSS